MSSCWGASLHIFITPEPQFCCKCNSVEVSTRGHLAGRTKATTCWSCSFLQIAPQDVVLADDLISGVLC